MTTTLTYPGVYLSETASVNHTVTAATTNLTAFLGVFSRGPIDEAVLVTSWGEFEQTYGSIDANSGLASYCIHQFFLNGGVGAWIVRLDNKTSEGSKSGEAKSAESKSEGTPSATAKAQLNALSVEARNPGTWGNVLSVELVASGGSIEPSTTLVELVVTEPGPEPNKKVTLERIGGIELPPTGAEASAPAAAETAAATITANSRYVTATVRTGTLAAAAAVPLTGGANAAWTPVLFSNAVQAALTTGTTAPLLDQIAPQVFNIMCIPDLVWCDPLVQATTFGTAYTYCRARQAFLLVDPPPPKSWSKAPQVFGSKGVTMMIGDIGDDPSTELKKLVGAEWGTKFIGAENDSAAAYYPWVEVANPAKNDQPILIPPSGTVAGIYAATDTARGVWKAPAGIHATLAGVGGLADTTINDTINGEINVRGVNVLRTFPVYGNVVWGSRTLAGADLLDSETKYVPVRRLADFVEQSLVQSLRWAVFEPNAPTLWASLTLEASQFMTGLYNAGAFAGETAKEAFSVVCDATTTSPQDQLNGVVNINVSFQAVDPVEFVVLNLHLGAGVGASS